MKLLKIILCVAILALVSSCDAANNDQYSISSPNGEVVVDFSLQAGGNPAYAIQYKETPVVSFSRLGFPDFNSDFKVTGTSTDSHQGEWINEYGERRVVPNNYRELHVDLQHSSGRQMRITFRAYNEGAALRYSFPEQQETEEFSFIGESTEFRFPANTHGYEAHGTEGQYHRVLTDSMEAFTERPLTLEYENGTYASLTEAGNLSYARMLLSPLEGTDGALVSALGGRTSNTAHHDQRHDSNVTLQAGESTPWRTFIIGDRPGDLLERNYLMLNLNLPSRLEDTSWIRPGTVMREARLNTENAMAVIDFAETAGLEYVHFDAGWYGPERSEESDATTVSRSNLDLQEVIDYGNKNDVGVWLYVNRLQMEAQRDTLLKLYEKWGVAGIKLGFVKVGSQEATSWLTETIAKAADHEIMVNVHDGYRSNGLERTYPNLMTVEGIRGNEHMPTASHNATLPFTRYVGGVGDYTVCYYTDRIKTTHAHQLAMNVVSFSKVQWVFWYDTPSDYSSEPEVEFFANVPTTWDETKVINGEIGQYATIVRRNGEEWFVGTVNNEEARQLDLPLDFLDTDRQYTATIYYDDESMDTRTNVGIREMNVNSTMSLDIPLKSSGGQAVWIRPAD